MTCTDPVAVRAGLELGASELQVQRSYRSAGDAAPPISDLFTYITLS